MTRTLILAAVCGATLLAVTTGCSSTGGWRGRPKPVASAMPSQVTPGELAPAVSPPALRYGGQVKCPVTGEALGSMGEPVAVTVRGRTVYVCCRGCAKRALADPTTTIAAVEAERAVK